jgi:Uma2 family endonuclease
MATTVKPTEVADVAPAPPYWTLDAYERAIDAGVFGDRRIELIGGQLYEMPPMEEPHIGAVQYLSILFYGALGTRARAQMPIILPSDGQPEPDISVTAPGAPLKPSVEHVQLAIEVSHATRRFDRGVKLVAYLADGLHELWIIDLVERAALMYRDGVLIARHAQGAGAKLQAEQVPEVTLDLDQVFQAAQLDKAEAS